MRNKEGSDMTLHGVSERERLRLTRKEVPMRENNFVLSG